jgi:hypothetical protein
MSCLPCPVGEYGTASGALRCEQCPTGTFNPNEGSTSAGSCVLCATINPRMTTRSSGAGSNASCICQAGYFAVGPTECATCASGVNCDVPGVSVQSLPVASGFWRSSPNSMTVVQCRIPHACAGAGSAASTGTRRAQQAGNESEIVNSLCAPRYTGTSWL